MRKSNEFSPEVRERAVRMVFEHLAEYESQWAAIVSIAAKIGCTAETLRRWVRQHERDTGKRDGVTTAERIASRRWSARCASCARPTRSCARPARISPGGARPPLQAVKAFIDEHRGAHGVEPICRVMQIAPSSYRLHAQRRAQPALRAARAQRDDVLAR